LEKDSLYGHVAVRGLTELVVASIENPLQSLKMMNRHPYYLIWRFDVGFAALGEQDFRELEAVHLQVPRKVLWYVLAEERG